MRGKRKLKVHWVNGVGETHKKHSTITPNTTEHSTKPTINPTQENKPHQTRCGGKEEKWRLGEKKNGEEPE